MSHNCSGTQACRRVRVVDNVDTERYMPSPQMGGYSLTSTHGRAVDRTSRYITDRETPRECLTVENVTTPLRQKARVVRHAHISKRFGNALIEKTMKEYSELLVERIKELHDLRGVEYRLRIYPWSSMDEERITLIRIELAVPRISGDSYRKVWSGFSKTVDEAADAYQRLDTRPATKREFRKLHKMFSKGVVPLWER